MKSKPSILYLCNKESTYSRNKVLLRALGGIGTLDCISSERSTYFGRTVEVLWRFFTRRRQNYDIIVVGFFAQLLMPFFRPFWRGPVLADCYISLFDSYVCDRKMARRGSLRSLFCRWLDSYLLRKADVVLTDTGANRDYLNSEFGKPRGRIFVVPISADEKLFPFLEPLYYREDEEIFEVLFFGAFIPLQGVETILRAAAMLHDEPVRIRMIGDGQTLGENRALAGELGLENVDFEGWRPVEQIAGAARRAHLLLGIFGATDKARRVVPNKVFEAVSMGKPVVTGDSAAIREYFDTERDIFTVPLKDPTALAAKIRYVRTNYSQALAVGEAGNRVFRNRLSERCVAEIIGESVKSLA